MPNVIEDKERGVVIIDEREIDDFIDEAICFQCSQPRIYYDDYDDYFCAFCNNWLEGACGDPTCDSCRGRPARPIM